MKNKPEHKDTTKELNLQEDIMSGITPEKLIEMITQIYLPRILNELMLSERSFYLSHNPLDSANGFYPRTLFFKEIIEWLKGESPYFAERLRRVAEHYVAFTRFPMEVRSRVKSTNASENLHKELERIRINTGGYFQSREVLYAKWQIYLRRLKERRWLKPEPKFKNVLGELHRLFWSIYEAELRHKLWHIRLEITGPGYELSRWDREKSSNLLPHLLFSSHVPFKIKGLYTLIPFCY